MTPSPHTQVKDPDASTARTTRWFVIGFAIVEALMLGWALLSGRIH